MSRQELAELVNSWAFDHLGKVVELDANYIGKLERGLIRWPQVSYRSALRATLGATRDADLGFRRPRRAGREPERDDVKRKEFLQVALGSGAAFITAHPLAELAEAFAGPEVPSRVSATDIEEIQAATRLLHSWDHIHGGGMARAAIGAQLRYATQLLDAQVPERLRGDLFTATGYLFCTAGFMAFDAFDHAEATRRYSVALACAQEVNDWHLRANVLSDMARQAFWTEDDESALTMIELSLVGGDHLVPAVRAMLLSLRARSLARQGRISESLTAIGTADEEFARTDPTNGPLTVNYYDAAEHAAETGHALADLAELGRFGTEARGRLSGAITGYGDLAARSRAFCQLRLSTLLMVTGDPREAVGVMQPALKPAQAIRSHRLALVANDLRAKAAKHADIPEVANLRQGVRAITA